MKIAISAAGPQLDSPVFDEFRHTPFLLIVNMNTMDCTSIPHAPRGPIRSWPRKFWSIGAKP